MKKKIDIVIGLGFGDEGKGNVTNALANEKSLVIRFNGGHQAGHNVHYGKQQHTFSSFGAGSLKGANTYISEFCTLNPVSFENERKVLKKKVPNLPNAFINENTMLTTPFDILEQQSSHVRNSEYGTVGVGFGTTIERNEAHFNIYARDLFYPKVLQNKLLMINKHYYLRDIFDENNQAMVKWMHAAMDMAKNITLVKNLKDISAYANNLIFEGAQGVMLDQHYGYFPHVTRSNTTVKNVFEILEVFDKSVLYNTYDITLYNVTRAYQTRHGAGPMSVTLPLKLTDDILEETNVTNKYQGEFRRVKLDYDLLKYAISCNNYELKKNVVSQKLIITCMDHLEKHLDIKRVSALLGIMRANIFVSYTPEFKFDGRLSST